MQDRINLIKNYNDFVKNRNVSFDDLALDIFKYQCFNNEVYKSFLNYLSIEPNSIKELEEIPFLPVSLFKKHKITTGIWDVEQIFESSSTTGMTTSKHYVKSLDFYFNNAKTCFSASFGDINDYCFMALLPSYLERNSSSLIFMVDSFIKESGCGSFYHYDYENLLVDLSRHKDRKKIILLGVTFALLEMAKNHPINLSNVMVMETGGMKGRGRELSRLEVHEKLKKAFKVDKIYSEYGMTELLSQSYSEGNGVFQSSATMKILISDIYDPFSYVENGKQGKINIIDLANIDTCSFLSTDDLGIDLGNGKFKVLGRTDESDIRGCNLLFT